MALWFALVLGIVQGLTEFLPISSTAHLRIAPTLLGQPDPGASYTAVIQLGTLLAVLIYFRRELFVTMPRALFTAPRSPDGRLPLYLALGTVPIVIAGIAFKPYIVGDWRSLYVVAGALAAVAGVMWWVDRGPRGARSIADVGARDALLIGLAQAMALVPGVSRSGATIAMALVLGFGRPQAARFSFLLGVPAIAGAGVFELDDAISALGADAVPALVVGTVAAAISGYAAIAWLIRFLGRRTLTPFVVYRVALAVLLLSLVVAGVVPALEGAVAR
jgi:undecaprenyl-diphosphatase